MTFLYRIQAQKASGINEKMQPGHHFQAPEAEHFSALDNSVFLNIINLKKS
jgi:hypothetical protein